MKRNFSRLASVLLCAAILTGVLITGAFAAEPFSDIKLQQVFDYDGFKTAVTIKPVYKDNGYANVSFAWGEIKTADGQDADVTGRAVKDNGFFFGFDVPVSEQTYTKYKVTFTVYYNLFGQAPTEATFTKEVSLKAPLDKSSLKSLIDTGSTKLSMRYTEESFAALTDPLAAANAFYADLSEQDYGKFNDVYDDLFNAINELKIKNEGFMDMVFKFIEMLTGMLYKAFGVSLSGML